MRKIASTSSLLTYLDQLEFTEAALAADTETAPFALAFTIEIAGWEGVFKKERASRREVTRAEAIVSVLDERLDETTTRFGGALLVEAKQDRKSPLFRRFFSTSPSELIRTGLRAQCERTRDTLLGEIANLDPASPLRAYEAPLRNGVDAALAALDARAKVKADRGIAAHDVDEWKEGVNRLRTTTYAELLKLATTNGHKKGWVEAFFPMGASDADEEAPPPPAPPAPNPA